MDMPMPLYAILRDRRRWDGIRAFGLESEPDGALTLSRLPGPADHDGRPMRVPPPYDVEPSGLAVGRCGDVYVVDGENQRIVYVDGLCAARMTIPLESAGEISGSFDTPGALLISGDRLYVADTGNNRILVFQLPGLEIRAIWENPTMTLISLSADSAGRVYVLDSASSSVMRLSVWGFPDAAYNAAMAAHPISPVSITVGMDDILYAADEASQFVLRYDTHGGLLDPLPTAWDAFRPGALASFGGKLYVHDRESGYIAVYDELWMATLGSLPGYRGPVAALAFGDTGSLYIKPGVGERYYLLNAGLAFTATGELEAGPLDAGEDSRWARVAADIDVPDGTWTELRLFATDDPNTVPIAADWQSEDALASALDTQIAPVPVTGSPPRTSGRYLWLRLRLESDRDQSISPRLEQIRAEASTETYLSYLPAFYAENDAPRGTLNSLLELFRSELGDLELQIEDIVRLCDPVSTPENALRWLSGWLGFDIPAGYEMDDARALLPQLHSLYHRRGTLDGLRQFIQLYTGVQAHIEEAYQQRGLWLLGQSSRLGFDTALAPALPDGMAVPGPSLADPDYQGLLGAYVQTHNDPQIKRSSFQRIEAGLNILEEALQQPGTPAPVSTSVVWTGQIQPHFSEVYSFYVVAAGSVSLWVDGQLLLENCNELAEMEHEPPEGLPKGCTDAGKTEYRGLITLSAGQWYTVTLKVVTLASQLTAQLWWSSRSQPKEIVPPDRLYAIDDDNIDIPTAQGDEGRREHFTLGETVVGEHGPLAKEDFGEPLFSPTAHQFSVLVPASQALDPATREAIIGVIEAEKPAHTDYHMCFVQPQMRVGFQARIGIDAVVAGPFEPIQLNGSQLGFNSALGDSEGAGNGLRVGQREIGPDATVG
jgi:phage tail-like protein